MRIVRGKGARVQRSHTLWASLEVLFAVVVAVTPTVYALGNGRHEDSSTDGTHLSEYPRGRTFSAGTMPEDKYTGSSWTELHDDPVSRVDSTSSQRALIAMRNQSLAVRIV